MSRRNTLLFLVLGLALGIAGTLLAPRFLGPYMPESIRGETEGVEGVVTAKREMSDRLLLTLDTRQGAILATFTERVPEITLLVDEGDSVTIALSRYEPFVTDPSVQSVRKSRGPLADDRPPQPGGEPDTLRPLREDTAAGRDTL